MHTNLVIQALAGTGKTTTLVEGLKRWMNPKYVGKGIKPSPQQEAIWETMKTLKKPKSVLFCAFNKSIQEELSKRVPGGCQTATTHSMGNRSIRAAYGFVRLNDKWKIANMLEKITGQDFREFKKHNVELYSALQSAYDMARLTLLGYAGRGKFDPDSITLDELRELCNKYEVVVNGSEKEILSHLKQLLVMGSDIDGEDGLREIDFVDMIWLPIVNELPVQTYDAVLVDEAQDLNACQQELVLRMSSRNVIVCGDVHQAIYGFAGADTDSIPNMIKRLERRGGVTELPLTVTYRCGQKIVDVANAIVPEYQAHWANDPGEVRDLPTSDFFDEVQDDDMCVCRVNAPLVSFAFKLLAMNRKAHIVGRDIGAGLIRFIKGFNCSDPGELLAASQDWTEKEVQKLHKQKRPNDARIIALLDRQECLEVFCQGCFTVDDILDRINDIFSDTSEKGIRLSSVHRAKGLEADNVYLLYPSLMPHPMAKSPWQQQQERNLKYVAITRAKRRLSYVFDDETV